jgi:integrase
MKNYARLTTLQVTRAKSGMLADGDGLYLQVTTGNDGSINRSWLFRYTWASRERWMGLGSLKDVSLAEARVERDRWRKVLRDGQNPIEVRRAERAAAAAPLVKQVTFDECRDAYTKSRRASWSAKHADQWDSSLENYVSPTLGKLPVAAIDTRLVMKVLEPLWYTRTETASRVRNRIEIILDWAKTRGHRDGDNPARWRGHISNLLPMRTKQQPPTNYSALPHEQVAEFMKNLRARDSLPAKALEFAVLTALRMNEVLGAVWDEFDLAKKMWSVPASRMKTKKKHQVPLSSAALALLDTMQSVRESDVVFPGVGKGGRVGQRSMLSVLELMGLDVTVHGFRSTFRDWAQECTTFPDVVPEMALAHVVGSAVERAYRRTDLFRMRRELMEQWADYCAGKNQLADNVVSLSGVS